MLQTIFTTYGKYKYFLYELIIKELKFKYRKSYLGILWSLLNPLLMAIVLSVVFSQLFFHNIPHYIVYLLTGKIIFDFFSEGTSTAMRSIVANSGLIRKVYVPKYTFPLAKIVLSFVNLLFSHIVLIIFIVGYQIKLTPALLFLPIPLTLLFIFTIGIGLILSSAFVFFRDIGHLYGVGLTAWMYLTPIIYPLEIVPDKYLFFFKCNPLLYFIENYRTIILHGDIPSFQLIIICFSIAMASIIIGSFIFSKTQDRFIINL